MVFKVPLMMFFALSMAFFMASSQVSQVGNADAKSTSSDWDGVCQKPANWENLCCVL
jgi:invasion protein IalB